MFRKTLLLSLCLFGLTCSSAMAHELMLKSKEDHPAKDAAYQLLICSGHRFIVSDEVEDIAGLIAQELVDGKAVDLKMTADEADSAVVIDAKGNDATQIFSVARLGSNYAVTNKGAKGGKDVTRAKLEAEGLKVKSCNRYDKYAKAVVNAKAGNDSYKTLVGQDLEIELLTNPAEVKVGDYVDVRVLHHGSPESVNVLATYDGFVKEYDNTYAYYTEGDPDGIAHIKITAPGTWMVRVESTEGGKDGEYDKRVIRTTLTFHIDG